MWEGLKVLKSEEIKACALDAGADLVGIARAEPLRAEASDLAEWLRHKYCGTMSWMGENTAVRNDPSKLLDECKSIISIAVNYYTPQLHLRFPNFPRISRYAWGRDYHKVLKKILKDLQENVNDLAVAAGIDDAVFMPACDTAPFRDKVWAQRAGLGWIGKNSLLITKKFGTWVFIGSILTNIELDPDQPHRSHCGKCHRCVDACPTGALLGEREIDSRACLSYLTIEHAGKLPSRYVENMSGWVFGCDSCQDVCPWNRFAKPTVNKDFEPRGGLLVPDLQIMSQMSEDEYNKLTTGASLRRAGHERLRRNALAVMGLL